VPQRTPGNMLSRSAKLSSSFKRRCVRPCFLADGQLLGRRFATLPPMDAPLSDMQEYLVSLVDENKDKFGGRGETFSKRDWFTLCRIACPGMHVATVNALFVTADRNRNGEIYPDNIYTENLMRILQGRWNHKAATHPVVDAYKCLPQPPFANDVAQEACIEQLVTVWDDVVADWKLNGMEPKPLKMVPIRVATPRAEDDDGGGLVDSLLRWLKSDVDGMDEHCPKKPKAYAPTGLYMYGVNGCGKTLLLDLFHRSLPIGYPVVRADWRDFQRDAFRSIDMAQSSSDENAFDTTALQVLKNCKMLLLDGLDITQASDGQKMVELCRYLWARGVATIFTSNYRPHQLCDGGNVDPEFIPELVERCPLFNFSAYHKTDHRRAEVDEYLGNYIHPISEETVNKIEDMQRKLRLGPSSTSTDSEEQVERNTRFEIPCEGSDEGDTSTSVTLLRTSRCFEGSAICQIDFHELVSHPRGKELDVALAMKYNYICITGATKFNLSEQSAAFKRFAAFIDTAYGKKCNLFIQAECPPGELFENPKRGREYISTGLVEEEYCTWVRMKSILEEMGTHKYQILSWLAHNQLVNERTSRVIF